MVLSLFYKLRVLRWDLTCYTFDLFSKLLELQERCGILSEFESQLLKIVQSVRKCHATSIDEIIRLLGCTYHSIDSSERNVTNMARLYSQCMLWKWFLFMLGVKLICRKKPQINVCHGIIVLSIWLLIRNEEGKFVGVERLMGPGNGNQ